MTLKTALLGGQPASLNDKAHNEDEETGPVFSTNQL